MKLAGLVLAALTTACAHTLHPDWQNAVRHVAAYRPCHGMRAGKACHVVIDDPMWAWDGVCASDPEPLWPQVAGELERAGMADDDRLLCVPSLEQEREENEEAARYGREREQAARERKRAEEAAARAAAADPLNIAMGECDRLASAAGTPAGQIGINITQSADGRYDVTCGDLHGLGQSYVECMLRAVREHGPRQALRGKSRWGVSIIHRFDGTASPVQD